MKGMKAKKLVTLVTLFMISFGVMAKGDVTVDVSVPGMSFKAVSNKVKGSAVKKGGKYQANNISVPVSSLKTEMDLRDEHLHEKLKGEKGKFTSIKILQGVAKGGKGKARILIRGVKKVVPFTYSVKGSKFVANFSLSLKDFGITGVSYMGLGVQDKVTVTASLPVK